MSFLAPGFLVAGGLAALALVGLHFLSTRQPRVEPFPTARFIPDLPLEARTLTRAFSDPWLLLLRLVLVLLVAAALAQPVWTQLKASVATVVLVDLSRAVADPREVVDSASLYLPAAEAVVFFDLTARSIPAGATDSLRHWSESFDDGERSEAELYPASLSAALIVAQRSAAHLRDRVDSVRIVVVSPFVEEQWDAATLDVRELWPGGIHPVRVGAAARDRHAGRDSVRVVWADSMETALWAERVSPDTIGGLLVGGLTLVHPFTRQWAPAEALNDSVIVLAHWIDGEPAILEQPGPDGCTRVAGFGLPERGDARARPIFRRFLSELHAGPCGLARDFTPVSDEALMALAGPPHAAAATEIRRADRSRSPLATWFLSLALLAGLAEPALRGRRRSA